MSMIDVATFDASVLRRTDTPESFSDFLRGSHCLYLNRLEDDEGSMVADFEVDPAMVDLSEERLIQRLGDYGAWLKLLVSEHFNTSNVLLNVGFKH